MQNRNLFHQEVVKTKLAAAATMLLSVLDVSFSCNVVTESLALLTLQSGMTKTKWLQNTYKCELG